MQRREKELYAYFLGIHMYTLPDFFSIQIIFACCRLIEVRSPNWFLSYPGLKSRFFDKSFNICGSFCSHNFSQSPFIDKIIGTFARSNRSLFTYLVCSWKKRKWNVSWTSRKAIFYSGSKIQIVADRLK